VNYLDLEILLLKKLYVLKRRFNLYGIKAEFEAEGSSIEDIIFLRKITSQCNTKLYVKIGGVEALNDIYNCIKIGVDGLIAPMVETKFGLFKFLEIIKNISIKKKPFLSINIESESGFKNLDKILKIAKNSINNITVGRSDFSKSYFNPKINQNSFFITKKIIEIAVQAKKNKLYTTVGGGVDEETIKTYKKNKQIFKLIKNMETRKVILPTKTFLKKNGALQAALDFEKHYILCKKQKQDFTIKSELNRLSILNNRE